MKNLLRSTVLSLGVIFSGEAIAMHSELNLKMHDNGAFTIMFDGNWVGQQVPSVSIHHINPGTHMLKVIRYFVNPWCGMMQPKVIFNGCITIPPASQVFSMIECNNCYHVINVVPLCGNGNGGGNYGSGYGQPTGYGNGGGHGYDPEYGDDDNGYGNYGGGCQAPCCMSGDQFEMLKNSIRSRSFDDSKMKIAQQAMGMNYLSATQVGEVMGLMTFESTKLSVAKSAYKRTIDKQNYYMVNDRFTFSSSIDELNDYISQQ